MDSPVILCSRVNDHEHGTRNSLFVQVEDEKFYWTIVTMKRLELIFIGNYHVVVEETKRDYADSGKIFYTLSEVCSMSDKFYFQINTNGAKVIINEENYSNSDLLA